jgi:exocyst complex component 7
MERLPEVQTAAGAALTALGDGNWKMGEGVSVQKSKLGEGDEAVILEHYVCAYEVSTSFLSPLTRISRRRNHDND